MKGRVITSGLTAAASEWRALVVGVVLGIARNGVLRAKTRSLDRALFAGVPLLAQLVAQPGLRLLRACHGVSS